MVNRRFLSSVIQVLHSNIFVVEAWETKVCTCKQTNFEIFRYTCIYLSSIAFPWYSNDFDSCWEVNKPDSFLFAYVWLCDRLYTPPTFLIVMHTWQLSQPAICSTQLADFLYSSLILFFTTRMLRSSQLNVQLVKKIVCN